VIVDLDNTLWGGILSEVGACGLELDPEEPLGRAFLEVQEEMLHARKMGYILAVCSRNHESEVMDVFDRSGLMRLKRADFAALSVSWESKDTQIARICEQLRVAESDAIFFDDDPHERDLIRKTLPLIAVPNLPESPYERAAAIRRFVGIENPFVTKEDRIRADTYVKNQNRDDLRKKSATYLEWLVSLQAELSAVPCTKENLERIHQLYLRTNQFNLRPFRREQAEVLEWSQGKGHQILAFHYKDRIGDDGLIGLVAAETDSHRMVVKDFLLSCRVFGRGLEDSMMQWVLEKAHAQGFKEIYLDVLNSGRNRVGMSFLARIGVLPAEGLSEGGHLIRIDPQAMKLATALPVKEI
jgi:FkbH-like protein